MEGPGCLLGEPTVGIPHLVECECVSLLDELIIKNIDHYTKQKEHWYWSIGVNQAILEKRQLIVLLNRIIKKITPSPLLLTTRHLRLFLHPAAFNR